MAQQSAIPIRAARSEDAAGIARVHVDSWRSTYRGLMPDSLLDNLSYERREQFWAGVLSEGDASQCLVVAEDGGQVVGFASGGPERTEHPVYKSELYAIYLLDSYQGRGIGRSLTAAVAQHLLTQGYSAMLVWVLRDNPSRAFYEAIGGKFVSERDITFGEATLAEVSYGWEDIGELAQVAK